MNGGEILCVCATCLRKFYIFLRAVVAVLGAEHHRIFILYALCYSSVLSIAFFSLYLNKLTKCCFVFPPFLPDPLRSFFSFFILQLRNEIFNWSHIK